MPLSRKTLLWFGPLIVLGACSRSTVPGDEARNEPPPASNTGTTTDQDADWAAIERIEEQAKAIAKVAGCTASGDCRTGAVGSRACGGPRYYIVYCAKTTDSAALAAKLGEVAKAEQAYNQKYQIASTCEMRLPPEVEASGGSCIARQ